MGSGRWDPDTWASHTRTTAAKPAAAIFTSRGLKEELNPKKIRVRESRDSVDNPSSTPIIVGIDVTGSMGMVAEAIARKGLGTLFQEIYDRKPVTDPHVMFMAIGDANCDSAPLQVSQFEADSRIIKQLEDIYIEQGGGGNNFESYNLPWYFAATHTSIDSYEKRGKRGYLFTIGDEFPPQDLTVDQIERVIGDRLQRRIGNVELLEMVNKMYHVFHVIAEEGSCARSYGVEVRERWKTMLGQRVIPLSDHTKISEVIISAIQVCEGSEKDAVADSWSKETALVVRRAINDLTVAAAKSSTAPSGVVRL